MDGQGHADTASECGLFSPAQCSLDYDLLAGIYRNSAVKLQCIASAIVQSWALNTTQHSANWQDT